MLENNEGNIEETSSTSVQNNEEQNVEAVQEIEKHIAENSEKHQEKKEIEMLDYASMDLDVLTQKFKNLLSDNPVQDIKAHVDIIKTSFNTKFGALLAEKKESFLAEGGNVIDFHFSSPVKVEYNKLLSDYKKKRDAYYNALEKQLKENLTKREAIIEELKQIIEKSDTKTMYNEYKALNDRWKSIGSVPRDKYNDVWKIYHHHVERFYDILHLNKNFRELEFKQNLEEKNKLIVLAEGLLDSDNINEAFKKLQELHRIWKEELGPVSKEYREDVWNKFSEITKKLHDKRHQFFKEMKGKYQEIIDAKLLIVDKLNAYDTSANKNHKDWQRSIKEVESIRQEYFNAGKLPYNKSEPVWQKLKEATKKFNAAKNDFYRNEKQTQNDNLQQKMKLVEIAESLKDSEDWEETANVMKRIQADWRKIGHVPRKFSDDIWGRFKGSCNHFFDRLHSRKNELNTAQQAVVDDKKQFLEVLKQKEDQTLEDVKQTISSWNELGVLPRNARHLDEKFNKVIDKQLTALNLDRTEIEMMKFKNTVDTYLAQENFKKLDNEQFFIRKKIDETVREMQQLENNLSFISNATEDNPFVINVRKGVQEFKNQLDVWHLKLEYLKKLDY